MPYDTPNHQNSASAAYRLNVQHTNGDEYRVELFGAASSNEATHDAGIQDLMDQINAHADLTCTSGLKTYESYEYILPTP